jgi:hypothetical protein
VTIQNNSATATDSLRVADEAGKLQVAGAAGLVYPANPLVLRGYTGPVCIAVESGAGAVPVSWWAVTE